MGRLFLILFAIFSALFVLRYIVRALPGGKKRDGEEPPAEGGDTVQCAMCGTYVPKVDAIEGDGKLYCSAQHRDQDQS